MTEPSTRVVTLAPDDRVEGRPFTDPAHTRDDLAALAELREAQSERVHAGGGAGTWQRDGSTHWLVTAVPERLFDPAPCRAIGFFGQARAEVDHTRIVELEHAILERPRQLPGFLSYHNVLLANGQWGNLVLFEADADTTFFHSEPRHAESIRIAPVHYHSLRLHRGTLPDGPFGASDVQLRETLYLDFDDPGPWRAIRAA
jgi:hypothetical protein